MPGLNVQFGALDFGSETSSAMADMAQTETGRDQGPAQVPASASMSAPTAVSTQQPQSSLFPKPGSIRWVYGTYLWLHCCRDYHCIALLHVHFCNLYNCLLFCHNLSFCHCFSFPGDSEHMSGLPSAVSDPKFPSPSLGLPSATPSSLGLASAATPASSATPTAASRVESSGPRSLPPHMGFPQNKDVPSSAPLTVGTK